MRSGTFDEEEFFRSIAASGARALLIGRRALVVLGLPLLTRDYDFWVHPDDSAAFNEALASQDLLPSCSPEEARKMGRYVLENDEHVDVMVARAAHTMDGQRVAFEDLWMRRRSFEVYPGVTVFLPCVEDLVCTKRLGGRPRDLEDIRMLMILLEEEREGHG